jgi:hypothetical protein
MHTISKSIVIIILLTVLQCLGFIKTALSVEVLSFNEITIANNLGEPQTEFSPGNMIKIIASFSLERIGVAILRGTVTGENWTATLPRRFRLGLAGDYQVTWTVDIPVTAAGNTQVEIILFNPLQERVIRSAFFTVVPYEAEYIGSTACSLCHPVVFAAWEKTLHYPFVGCEVCHGPGSKHVLTQSPQFIKIDTSSQQCGICHSRNNGTVIEARDGFIIYQQQYNEFIATKHGSNLECVTCHNPHYSTITDSKKAIKVTCQECHPSQKVDLLMEGIDCTQCHMPFAVLKLQSTGTGLYRKGDQRTHIVRIKTQANPQEMFTAGGNAIRQDAQGAFITDNFSCLGCHNGTDARLYDFESVRKTTTLIHY